MPQQHETVLEPRKLPQQARSAASVEAILEATIQVLLSAGKEQLTTTRVAARAGVSVGTLYQYFPNKSALLQAALRRHLEEVTGEVERVCREQKRQTLRRMATALVTAFLDAKMRDLKRSVALYAVSADLDGAAIVAQMSARCNRAIVAMLMTAREALHSDPQLVAAIMQGAMAGIIRGVLESDAPEQQLDALRRELIFLIGAYLDACSTASLRHEVSLDAGVAVTAIPSPRYSES